MRRPRIPPPPTSLVLVLLVSACAGDLENPDRFEAPTQDGCDLDVVEDIFEPKCGNPACHGAGEGPAADLDLVSPGVADRLVGVEAGAEGQCVGRVRVDPNDVDGSLLLEKLEPDPSCGDRMPLLIEPLSAEEIACVRDWVRELAPEDGADAGVTPDGGDS